MSIPVVLPCNEQQAALAAALMASVCANTQADVEFYVIDLGLRPGICHMLGALRARFANLSALHFVRPDVRRIISSMPQAAHLGLDLIRYMQPQLVAERPRIICLSPGEIFLEGGDIAELLACDLQGCLLGACRLITLTQGMFGGGMWPRGKRRRVGQLRMCGPQAVFDPGVLVIDAAAWCSQHTLHRLLELSAQLQNMKLPVDDCFVLYKYLNGEYAHLDRSWNVPFQYASIFYLDGNYTPQEMRVLHYNAHGALRERQLTPPWSDPQAAGAEHFWKYADLTPWGRALRQHLAEQRSRLTRRP